MFDSAALSPPTHGGRQRERRGGGGKGGEVTFQIGEGLKNRNKRVEWNRVDNDSGKKKNRKMNNTG